eukprot:1898608-Alexandrium_andersonii.AAC.1
MHGDNRRSIAMHRSNGHGRKHARKHMVKGARRGSNQPGTAMYGSSARGRTARRSNRRCAATR